MFNRFRVPWSIQSSDYCPISHVLLMSHWISAMFSCSLSPPQYTPVLLITPRCERVCGWCPEMDCSPIQNVFLPHAPITDSGSTINDNLDFTLSTSCWTSCDTTIYCRYSKKPANLSAFPARESEWTGYKFKIWIYLLSECNLQIWNHLNAALWYDCS